MLRSALLRAFAHSRACLLAGLVVAQVSGCSSSIENWDEVRVAPQPAPKLISYHHFVPFSPGSGALTAAARQDLDAFLAEMGLRYGDSIELSATAGGPPAGTAREALVRQRLTAVARAVQTAGVPTYQRRGSTSRTDPADAVAVDVRRYVVVLPTCPDWTGEPGRNYANQPGSNWGCATAVNFGTMVANPADLARGHELLPGDGERLSRSINRYRNDITKPLLGNTASEVSAPQETKDSAAGGEGG